MSARWALYADTEKALRERINVLERLLDEKTKAIYAVQRSAYSQGFQAGMRGEDVDASYKEWSHT